MLLYFDGLILRILLFFCSNSLFAGIRLIRNIRSTQFVKNFIKSQYYCRKMDAKLEAIPLVDIDDEGRFKYILIKVYGREQADGTEPSKLIVRGYKRAQWHGNERIVPLFNQRCCIFLSIYLY